MKTKVLIILLVAVSILGGCQSTKTEATNEPANQIVTEEYVFTDDCKREVEIPKQIDSIVPSGPLSQMVLYSLAPEKFVALSNEWQDNAKQYIPEQYYNLPVLGQVYGSADLNIEELAATNPQLIIDIGESKKSIKEDMDEIQNTTKIPSVHIEADLKSMPEAYRKMGTLLGEEEKAEELAVFCEKVLKQTDSVMQSVGDNKVSTLYILGDEGLNVLANGSYHAELTDMLTNNVAVVDNPVGKGTGNEVTMEQIALWNPEYIIFAPDSIYEGVESKDTWKNLDAIANKKYVEVPAEPYNWMGNPPSVQRYLGLIWLTSQLYPEYCDYDVKSEIVEYYKVFYNYELTDEEYERIMMNSRL